MTTFQLLLLLRERLCSTGKSFDLAIPATWSRVNEQPDPAVDSLIEGGLDEGLHQVGGGGGEGSEDWGGGPDNVLLRQSHRELLKLRHGL